MKTTSTLKIAAAFVFAICSLSFAQAQLIVTPEPSDTNLIFSLAGPGIIVSNPVRNCADTASGFFDASSAMLDLTDGVLLTTGSIYNALGPNNSSSMSQSNLMPGDPQLDMLPDVLSTNDACAIEFDMTVASDTLKLDYIFGSEEYLEFVGSFNDVFAFYLSGPGIVDSSGLPDTVNIARVPGTGDIVSINSINDFTNASFYQDNGDGFSSPFADTSLYIQYDGLTVGLQANWPVMAGGTYHMKLVVADDLDYIFDSGTFLKSGALGSLRLAASTSFDGGGVRLVEGCVDGNLTFARAPISSVPVELGFAFGGSADAAADFAGGFPTSATIAADEASVSIPLSAVADAAVEGTEELVLYLFNPQSGYVFDSLTIQIAEQIDADFTYSQPTPLAINVVGSPGFDTYSWDFGDGAPPVSGATVSYNFPVTGAYMVCMTAVDADGCSMEHCKTIETLSTGLEAGDILPIRIYPNPSNGLVQLDLPYAMIDADVRVFDLTGKEVFRANYDLDPHAQLDLSKLATGQYEVLISVEDKYYRSRLTIE